MVGTSWRCDHGTKVNLAAAGGYRMLERRYACCCCPSPSWPCYKAPSWSEHFENETSGGHHFFVKEWAVNKYTRPQPLSQPNLHLCLGLVQEACLFAIILYPNILYIQSNDLDTESLQRCMLACSTSITKWVQDCGSFCVVGSHILP